MGHGPKFESATLRQDGKVEVTGPFTEYPRQWQKPAVVVFSLVQDGTQIDGQGSWQPGATEWTGTGDSSGLTTGDAQAVGLAVLAVDNPPATPAFVTFSWSDQVKVTNAD
jgi:hypothetical protein